MLLGVGLRQRPRGIHWAFLRLRRWQPSMKTWGILPALQKLHEVRAAGIQLGRPARMHHPASSRRRGLLFLFRTLEPRRIHPDGPGAEKSAADDQRSAIIQCGDAHEIGAAPRRIPNPPGLLDHRALNPPAGQQHDHHDQSHAQESTGAIAPAAAVAPGRERADQEEDKHDKKNCSNGHQGTFFGLRFAPRERRRPRTGGAWRGKRVDQNARTEFLPSTMRSIRSAIARCSSGFGDPRMALRCDCAAS